jgi:HAE1 family hydrophobic/amphiphilic exporter-1
MLTKSQKYQATDKAKGKRQKAKGKLIAQGLALYLAIGLLLPLVARAQEDCEEKKPKSKLSDKGLVLPASNVSQNPPAQNIPAQNPPQSSAVTPGATPQMPTAERVGVNVAEQTPLTLEEAIAFALANNKDINASRIDVELARYDVTAAKGVYDPKFSLETYSEHRETPVASAIAGSSSGKLTTTDAGATARLSGNTPLAGGVYQIDLTASRQTTDNLFTSLNPQFPSGITATYTQPLLKGRSTDDNRRRIEIAKKNLSLTDSQFRQRAIETITRVQQAYWDLVSALRNLQVQNDAVTQARAQLESNKRQVEQGTLAPIDIVSAEVQVTNFEQNVYLAQESVTRAENNLKQLMLPNRTEKLWSRALTPTTPMNLDAPQVQLDDAVKLALASRPELEQSERNAEINKINQKFFSNQLKPQIDLFGTFTSSGLAGVLANNGPNPFTAGTLALTNRINEISSQLGLTPLPPTASIGVPDALIGSSTQSFANLFGFNYPAARVGIRFSFPFGNRTAEANYGHSLAEGRRIQNQREQLEQTIESDVRNALQALRSGQARLTAATASRVAAEQQSESEQRKFQAGLSTVFLVLQRQQELISARGREVQAQTDLNKAIADFQRATGSTFKANNITVVADTNLQQVKSDDKAAISNQ